MYGVIDAEVKADLEMFRHCAKVSGEICESLKSTSDHFTVMANTVDKTSIVLDTWIDLCKKADERKQIANDFVYNGHFPAAMVAPQPHHTVQTVRLAQQSLVPTG
jgi:hypothetical protein